MRMSVITATQEQQASHRMTDKPTVLVVGGTGTTGTSIIERLIESNNFVSLIQIQFCIYFPELLYQNVIVSTRPTSSGSPKVAKLKNLGAAVRVASLEAPYEGLEDTLKGVDIVISTVDVFQLNSQIPLIDAAKRAGVKRFIPCDFGTPGSKGVGPLVDQVSDLEWEYCVNR